MHTKLHGIINIAIKAGKVLFGQDTILAYPKKIYGIIVCHTASANTHKSIENFCTKNNLDLSVTVGITLAAITHKENNKVIAITNKSLYNECIANGIDHLLVNQAIKGK